MKIEFTKATASGNDFVIIDARNIKYDFDNEKFVKLVCNRKFGIGADGLILIEKDIDNDFIMRYFNSDGLEGSLCGNGARCASKYMSLILKKDSLSFKAIGNIYKSEILEKSVKLYLPKININIDEYDIDINNLVLKSFFINTGSPHLIILENEFIKINNIQDIDVFEIGKRIRYHRLLQPNGANVNFVKRVDDNTIRIRTYERGVEDETLACGTGSIASAIICFLKNEVQKPIKILTQGGEVFVVDFKLINGFIDYISLEGSANLVFDGFFFYKKENNLLSNIELKNV